MNKLTLILIIVIFGLGITSFFLYRQLKSTEEKYSISRNNERAYALENKDLKNGIRVFQFSTEQLKYLNDSLTSKLDNVRRELNIKDKNIKQMQYLLSQASRKDTIVFRDTLFVDKTLDMDTIIGDEWYKMELGLKYPNIITTNPSFTSEKYIFMSSKKETIDPPKKFFLCRWLQKKHTVVEVNIIEKNPYIEEKENRFIEILK